MPHRKSLVRWFNNIVVFPVLLTLVYHVNLEQEDAFRRLSRLYFMLHYSVYIYCEVYAIINIYGDNS